MRTLAVLGLAATLLAACGGGSSLESREGTLDTGSLACASVRVGTDEETRFDLDEGNVALVVVQPRNGIDVELQVAGDIDFIDEITAANPDATEGDCAAIIASVNAGGPGEAEAARVYGYDDPVMVEVGGPDDGHVDYTLVEGTNLAGACDAAAKAGLAGPTAMYCDPDF